MSEHASHATSIRRLAVRVFAAAVLTTTTAGVALAQQPPTPPPDSSAQQAKPDSSVQRPTPTKQEALQTVRQEAAEQAPEAGPGAFKTSVGAMFLVPMGGGYAAPQYAAPGDSSGRLPSMRVVLSTQTSPVVGIQFGYLRLAPDFAMPASPVGGDTATQYAMNAGIFGFRFNITHGRFRIAPFFEGGAGYMEAMTDVGGYSTTGGVYMPRWQQQTSPMAGGGGGLTADVILGPGFTFNFLGGFWHFQPMSSDATVGPISSPFVGVGVSLTFKNRPWYWRTSGQDAAGPMIAVVKPEPDANGNVTVGDSLGELQFLLSDLSGVKQLVVNGKTVNLRSQKQSPVAGTPVVGEGAYAQLDVELHPGPNAYRVTATDGAGNQRTRSFDVMGIPLDRDPPTIAVLSPESNASVADAMVTISGVVSDQGDIPEVTVNGMRARVGTPSADELQKANVKKGFVAKRFEASVPVEPGTNTVKIVAQDTAAQQNQFELQFQGPSAPVVAAAEGPPTTPASGIRPVIEIRSPREWGQTTRGLALKAKVPQNKDLQVQGIVRYANGIREVKIGGARAALNVDQTGTTAEFSGFVPVSSDATQVAIEAVGTDGVSETRVFPLQPEAPANAGAASFASFAGPVKHERWAVVIGISDYHDPQIPDLKYADKDAKSVYDFLRSPAAGLGGLAEDHIRLLLDDSATTRNVRSALLTFLRKSTDDDVIFVYIAGHGAPDPERPQNAYILTYDTELKDLPATALPMTEVSDALSKAYAYNKVLVADACHSGE
ncbi:MAG TPA: caspase family protein, partial [Longimicrobiales bacterium]|nr:caspase family protein [Longimicrobiales bacterium]